MQIPIYVINLDRSSQRMQLFSEHARTIGFAFERIAAVDGASMTRAEVDAVRSSVANYIPSAAEVACFLSHRKAWRAFHESAAPWGVVFEDDVRISPEFPRFLGRLEWAPDDADILKIEAWPRKKVKVSRRAITVGNRGLRRLKGLALGSAGYAISRRAAELLLADQSKLARPADNYLFSPKSELFVKLTTYVLMPALCIQERFLERNMRRTDLDMSLIHPPQTSKPALSTRKKVRREWKRLLTRTSEMLTCHRTVEMR